ncbi:hypothetical protein ACE2AJ_19245 [Aquihabitans daechungensis]|uniref:hypothetical protein n=1 Tax=Aquihabitans daechungensis TaxID=1052257 RepID=UPI003BA013FA
MLALFVFMFKDGGTDQERLDRIAADEPASDGASTIGPDGKPLTEAQLLDVAKLEAAKAEASERTCSVLRKIRNADIAMGNAGDSADSLDALKGLLIEASNQTIPLYDEAIPVIPEQADNMRKLQQFSRDTIAMVQASGDLTDLQSRLKTLSEQALASGTIAAATQLDAFATSTCGFSVGNN